jgi:PAS domain S-box-containing protein
MATILILDDSPVNRSIFARLATTVEDGVATEVFADPLDALEWLEHNRADLVITDFKMPGMDGAAFTRRLRTIAALALTPVLVVTAHDDRSFRVRALDAGATDFLQSPIDHFEFVARARNLLALSRRLQVDGGEMPAQPRPGQRGGLSSFSRILDAVPAMISATDRSGLYVYANAAFAAAVGSRLSDILGSGVLALLGPEQGGANRERDLQVFETGSAMAGYREVLAHGGGAPVMVMTTKTPLRDSTGSIVAVVTTSFTLPDESEAASSPDGER